MLNNRLPETGELSFKNERDEEQRIFLGLVGPSTQGLVYRSSEGLEYFRVIPIHPKPVVSKRKTRRSDDTPIERRHEIRQWIATAKTVNGKMSPAWMRKPEVYGIAPIVEADLGQIGASPVYFMRYGLHAAQSMVEVLRSSAPLLRIKQAIKLLLALPTWWEQLYAGFIPMPADIVFSGSGQPFMLSVPFWRFPDIDSVISGSERVFYLAPEYVRGGQAPLQERNLDTYAVGAMLMQCFFHLPQLEDEGLMLLRAATGGIWNNLQMDLPFWMQSLAPVREAVAAVQRTVDRDPRVRGAFDALDLSKRLDSWLLRMDPRSAVVDILHEKGPQLAYLFIQDVLLTEGTGEWACELNLIAARFALNRGRWLEAADFYEKAIAMAAHQPAIFEEQLRLLLSPEVQELLPDSTASQGDARAIVEAQIRRDFDCMKLPFINEELELEVKMALYLFTRDAEKAAKFIHSRLVDTKGNFFWKKFRLWLLYIEALLQIGQPDLSAVELNKLMKQLREAHNKGAVKEVEMAEYRLHIDRLKGRLINVSVGKTNSFRSGGVKGGS